MTRRLRGGREGVSYSDADAVAAVNAWREAQPPVVQVVPLAMVSPALVPFATMVTSSLAGGVYELAVSALATGTNSGTLIELRIFVGGVDIFGLGPLFPFNNSASVIPFSAVLPLTLPPGPSTIEFKAGQPTSPGTATAELAVLMLDRYL